MRPINHIFTLYALIALLLIMSTQRHAKLNATVQLLKGFQQKSSETRLHFMNEIDGLQNRIAILESGHGRVKVHTVRPVDPATGNRK